MIERNKVNQQFEKKYVHCCLSLRSLSNSPLIDSDIVVSKNLCLPFFFKNRNRYLMCQIYSQQRY